MKKDDKLRRGNTFNNPFVKLKALPKPESPPVLPVSHQEPPPKPTSHDEDVALFFARVGGTQRLREDPRGHIVAPPPDKNVTLNEMHDLFSQIDRGSTRKFASSLKNRLR